MKSLLSPSLKLFTSIRWIVVAAVAISYAANSSRAHSVWIEPMTDGPLVIRFGELDGNMEKSPGHLDELTVPVAVALVTNTPTAVEALKKSNHFALLDSSRSNVVCAETSYQVMGTPGNPGRKPNFYARWHPPAAGGGIPALTLDLVPTGKPGEARVYFRGKPLGGVKAVFRTPDERERELTADSEGFLRFASSQSGQHHLSIARHRETLAGFHEGRAYDLTSHNAALTWVQP
jgi:hypothetical protein